MVEKGTMGSDVKERLLIDVELCRECGECEAACSYPYHPGNTGVEKIRDLAARYVACRRCEVKVCTEVCPSDALEADEDGILHRYNMLCTHCLSCTLACPFGTLLPHVLEFKDSVCDWCLPRRDEEPECVRTCPKDAIKLGAPEPEVENIYIIGDHLAVKTEAWKKIEGD